MLRDTGGRLNKIGNSDGRLILDLDFVVTIAAGQVRSLRSIQEASDHVAGNLQAGGGD